MTRYYTRTSWWVPTGNYVQPIAVEREAIHEFPNEVEWRDWIDRLGPEYGFKILQEWKEETE